MQKLLKTVLNLPHYSPQGWISIFAVKNLLSKPKQYLAIIKEMQDHEIYPQYTQIFTSTTTSIQDVMDEMVKVNNRIYKYWQRQTDMTLTGEILETLFKELMLFYFGNNTEKMQGPFQYMTALFKRLKLNVPNLYCFTSLNNALTALDEKPNHIEFVQRQIDTVVKQLTRNAIKFNAVKVNIPTKVKKFEDDLNLILEQQFEIEVAHRTHLATQQYQTRLRQYIRQEIQTHYLNIYIEYFNAHPQLVLEIHKSTDPIINIYNQVTQTAPNEALLKIMQERPNLQRAVANYQRMANAENILTFSPHNRTPQLLTPRGRLDMLFKCYGNFENHLHKIDSVPVDNSTHKIKRFFKMLWNTLHWYFAGFKLQEKKLSTEIKFLHEQYSFFKNTQNNYKHKSEINSHTQLKVAQRC